MSDLPTTAPAQLPLAVVLTCRTCARSYEPDADAVARGRLGCPDPSCRGWTFDAALTVPSTTGGAA